MRTISRRQRSSPVRPSADYERLLLTKELEWLRTLTHVAPVGIFRADQIGRCSYVNEHWTELSGRSAGEAVGTLWEQLIHPGDVAAVRSEWERCLAARLPFCMEHRFVHRNGRIVWALSRVAREVDGRGNTTAYTGMSTDITELRQIREELQRSHHALEVRMRARSGELQNMGRIVESIDDAVVSCDLEGRVRSWNDAAEKIFGYRESEMIGQSVFLIAAESRQEESRHLEQQLREGLEIHQLETLAVNKAGQQVEMAISGFPLRDEAGTICGTWAIMRDITQRKRAERQLQQLSWNLMKVQDGERRRIARDLHDSTAQALAALAMNLAALARENSPLPEERRKELLRDSAALVDQATRELRTTAYLLHPPLLDERGLRSALGWLIDGFSARSGIKVNLHVATELQRLPRDMEIALFHMAQESLHNVHRHSGSRIAELRITIRDAEVRVEIRDWGCGIDASRGQLLGVGIAGMRERLLQFGGTLELEFADPGTRVIASVRIP